MKMQLCILRAIKNWRVHRLVFYVESNKKFKWKKTKNWLAWSIPVRMNDLWRQLGSPKRNLPKRVYPHKWFLQNLARKRESQVPSLMPYYTAVTFKMWSYSPKIAKKIIFYLRVRLSVCLSVCLSVSRITQKRVHGFGWNVACRQMSGHGWTDFWAPSGLSSGCRNRIAFSDMRCNADFYYVGKIRRTGIERLSLQRRVVLKWFYSPRAVETTLSEVHALHRVPF